MKKLIKTSSLVLISIILFIACSDNDKVYVGDTLEYTLTIEFDSLATKQNDWHILQFDTKEAIISFSKGEIRDDSLFYIDARTYMEDKSPIVIKLRPQKAGLMMHASIKYVSSSANVDLSAFEGLMVEELVESRMKFYLPYIVLLIAALLITTFILLFKWKRNKAFNTGHLDIYFPLNKNQILLEGKLKLNISKLLDIDGLTSVIHSEENGEEACLESQGAELSLNGENLLISDNLTLNDEDLLCYCINGVKVLEFRYFKL